MVEHYEGVKNKSEGGLPGVARGVFQMIFRIKELRSYQVIARDGVIGEVEDFYFDDSSWSLRYLVVSGDEEIGGRKLLISTVAINQPDYSNSQLSIDLSREIVKNSPEVTFDRPITREVEVALHSYYDWPFYWEAAGVSAYPFLEMVTDMKKQLAKNEDVHPLRSANQMLRLNIHARDGSIGLVDDFLVEDEKWKMLYMVVDTGDWLPGRKVIISPQWVENIRWAESIVEVDLSQETIKNSPEYDSSLPLDSDYESRISEYYGRKRE